MKTVLIFSGGMDSATLLWHLLAAGDEVICLGVDYGQRHRKELEAAAELARIAGVEFQVADLSALRPFLAGSSQTSDDVPVPDGHYAEETMKATVVPNRNMLMLSVAGAWAISRKFDRVAYGAHGGDHAIYPDCRPEFADRVDEALRLADWHEVRLSRPFLELGLDKTGIARLGAALSVPYEKTWSCYKGGDVHCGTCGTCHERREAFQLAGVPDPTEYRS